MARIPRTLLPRAALAHPPWSSPFASWNARALTTPLPNPHTFTPTTVALVLAVLLNAQAELAGITLALFAEPDGEVVAVDALGRVLRVPARDATGILELAEKALELRETGAFGNTWFVQREGTCYPNHRVFIPSLVAACTPSGVETLDHIEEAGVQGFHKMTRGLRERVQGMTELPGVLWELMRLVLEAREE